MKPKVFSTGDIAKITGSSVRKVADWIDSGEMPGSFRLPHSKHRRVPEQSFRDFLKMSGMPTIEEFEGDE